MRVTRAGIVESVISSLSKGRDNNFVELPYLQAAIIKHAQLYAASLNTAGVAPPVVVFVSLVGMKGMRLVQDFIERSIPEDLPFEAIADDQVSFAEAIFETVPADLNESAKMLSPLLLHMANAAGLPAPPYFDADGNYTLRTKIL